MTTAVLVSILLTLSSMTFKYDKKVFSFEASDKLTTRNPSTSDFDDNITFEQEFENKPKDITVTFRLVDFSKQGKIKTPNVNDEKTMEIANDYMNDIKMTGQTENLELPFKTPNNWIAYSAVLKLSQDRKSSNVFYSKRYDNFVLVVSIGSIKTQIDELKIMGQGICSSLKVADE